MNAASQFFWFGLAGVLGFCVDAGLLYLLKGALGLFVGRAISFCAAVFTTWCINRARTFRHLHSNHPPAREFAIYFVLMLGGGLANYGLYAWLVSRYPLIAAHPVIGVAAGTCAGMMINVSTSRFLLFRFKRT